MLGALIFVVLAAAAVAGLVLAYKKHPEMFHDDKDNS